MKIKKFAESLYSKMIENFNDQTSSFALLTRDDATFPELPGITSANLRNVLLGGKSSGTASIEDFIKARAEYDSPFTRVSYDYMLSDGNISDLSTHQQHSFFLNPCQKMKESELIGHLIQSTYIITTRIWSEEQQCRYIRKLDDKHILSKQVIWALFGIRRKQIVSLVDLQLPLRRRIALLNECANICHVLSPKHRITNEVAHRVYERIVIDPCGAKRKKIDISSEAENFPEILKKSN
jgi:hypothetical protein